MALDLTAIKARQSNSSPEAIQLLGYHRVIKYMGRDIDSLIAEVERLTAENKRLSDAIIEYNDAELYYAHKDGA